MAQSGAPATALHYIPAAALTALIIDAAFWCVGLISFPNVGDREGLAMVTGRRTLAYVACAVPGPRG